MPQPLLIRTFGFVAGLILAATLIASFRLPATHATALGADVALDAPIHGELGLSPLGPLLRAKDLRPHGFAGARTARVRVRNETPVDLFVRPRILSDQRGLDRHVRVALSVDGAPIWSGRLGELRRPGRGFGLRFGDARDLRLDLWLPRGTRGHEARSILATLTFTTRRLAPGPR